MDRNRQTGGDGGRQTDQDRLTDITANMARGFETEVDVGVRLETNVDELTGTDLCSVMQTDGHVETD